MLARWLAKLVLAVADEIDTARQAGGDPPAEDLASVYGLGDSEPPKRGEFGFGFCLPDE